MMDELPIVKRINAASQLLCGLETGKDCADYAFARGDGFQAMTYIPEAFEALRVLPEAADLISELAEALRALIPTNVCDNPNIENDYNFPCDITMGELRQAWDALAKATTHER